MAKLFGVLGIPSTRVAFRTLDDNLVIVRVDDITLWQRSPRVTAGPYGFVMECGREWPIGQGEWLALFEALCKKLPITSYGKEGTDVA